MSFLTTSLPLRKVSIVVTRSTILGGSVMLMLIDAVLSVWLVSFDNSESLLASNWFQELAGNFAVPSLLGLSTKLGVTEM